MAKAKVKAKGPTVEVEIASLGVRGDGIADSALGRLYVPYAAPGDRLRVRLGAAKGDGFAASITKLLRSGTGRVDPPCRHFRTCGGCTLQHVEDTLYRDWKRALVSGALHRRGLDPDCVQPLIAVAPRARRRVRFSARATKGGVKLGFFEPGSHRVVDIEDCLVVAPEITALLVPLRGLLGEVLPIGAASHVAVTLTDGGLDVVLGLADAPDAGALGRLVEFAGTNDLARLSWSLVGGPRHRGEGGEPPTPVCARRPAVMVFEAIEVALPPDGFVQPTTEGAVLLSARVLEAVAGAGRIADLFAGCGAFSFALAAGGARVEAADGDATLVSALNSAARANGLGERVSAETRDLARRPLTGDELKGLDAVVLDPPRGGAAAQAKQLAAATVPTVAYVSCNPASFAHDARVLVDGGYGLEAVTPLDQFPFTHHVELAALFRRR